jgi:hypothetical protein
MKISQKKGDPTDMLIVIIAIFVLAILMLVFWYVTTSISTALTNSPINITATQPGIQSISDLGTRGASQAFAMIFGALLLGVVITSFLVRIHPIFLFIYIILLVVTIILAVFLGNAYGQLKGQSPFDSAVAANPLIDFVMTHIVRIALGVGALSIIIIFAKLFAGEPAGGVV